MTRRDRFHFGAELGDSLRQGLPPVVGSDGGSTWFGNDGHLSTPEFPLAGTATGRFYLGIDVQPDGRTDQIVLGSQSRSAFFKLVVNADDEQGAIVLHVRDAEGHELLARAQGSRSAARRLLLHGRLSANEVEAVELQAWTAAPGQPLDLELEKANGPVGVPTRTAGLAVPGLNVDGHHEGEFSGRLAEFFVGDRDLPRHSIAALAQASDNPTHLAFEALGEPSAELRDRFRRDLARLRRWSSQSTMSFDDLEDASLILHRWLFDNHPVLAKLAQRLGIQLWLPGMSGHERVYLDAVLDSRPMFQMSGSLGPDSAFGFSWQTLESWRKEPAFHINGHAVSHEAFVKFVRNKLGAGHFDEEDRKRWQQELLQVSSGLQVMGQDALAYQMKAIVDAVLLSVASCRVEAIVIGP